MRIAWPEKVVGFFLAIEVMFLVLLPSLNGTPWTLTRLWATTYFWFVPAYTLTPLWIVLRMLDRLAGGPARRSRYRVIGFVP